MRNAVNSWLAGFSLHEHLHAHTADVFCAMPEDVRQDLMADPSFTMLDYEPRVGRSYDVLIKMESTRRGPARSVVLKRTLLGRPTDFVRWVIAHELAHAHLRNAGRWPGDDPESAADALAAGWGFPKPEMTSR